MIFYFSGTGNSRWVAMQLAVAPGERVYNIGKEIGSGRTYSLRDGEAVGFVFPVYSWGPPAIVLHFLRSVHLSDGPDFLYFVCTCGDDTGKTADIFCKEAAGRGWVCRAGYSVTMPNTYVCLPFFDVDSREVASGKLQEARLRVQDLAQKISGRVERFDCYEGAMPRLKTYLIRPLFNRFCLSPRKFRATDGCVSCGLCAENCPVHTISLKEKPVWNDGCTMCLSCYHHCPKHAIAYGHHTRGKGQYVCPLS